MPRMPATRLAAASMLMALALGGSAARAAPPWDATQTLSPPFRFIGTAVLGVDRRGDAVAVWPGDGVVEATSRTASGAWAPPTVLARITGAGNRGVQLAVAPTTGEAVAAWEYRPANGRTVIEMARVSPATGRWSAGAPLAAAPRGAIRPTLGFDDAGGLTAAWYWNGVVQTASRPAGGAFPAVQTLTAPGPGLDAPVVAVGARGDAITAWDRFMDPVRTIESASRPAGAAPERIAPVDTAPTPSPYLTPPTVVVDGNGGATALWGIAGGGATFRILTADRPAGGSWSAPVLLHDARMINGSPSLAGDAAGDDVASWVARGARGGQVVRVASRSAGGVWSQSATISSPARQASRPAVALDRAGNAAAIWTEGLSSSRAIVRVALRRAGETSWGRAQTIAGARRPRGIAGFFAARDASVAFGGGRLTAAWTECTLQRGGRIQLYVERCVIASASRPA